MLLDYIVTLGLDGFKGLLGEKFDERQMKEAIKSYVEEQRSINFNCPSEKEIDFDGLAEYLCTNAHKDLVQRLTGKTSVIRGKAHRHIVALTVSYAQAHTPDQKKQVKKMVNDVLNILRAFYERKLTKEQKYLASRIAEDVSHQLETQTAVLTQVIRKSAAQSPLSHEQARQLAQEEKLDILGEALTELTETVSASHVLSPYYGFQPQTVNGKQQFVSIPLTEEARKLYPPHFKCSGKAYIDGHEVDKITPDLFDYANNHQRTIQLVVEKAHKYLGTKLDPQQCETEEIIGEEFFLQPKPFPEAMAYSLIIDNTTYYEYILLRAKEKFEDGTAIFTNDAQKIPFKLKIKFNPGMGSVEFASTINGGSSSDHLKYLSFLKAAYSNGRVEIHHLESGINLLVGKCSETKPGDYIERLERVIAFLKNMVTIEQYFNEKIDVPEQVTSEEVELVYYLATLLQEDEIRSNWTKYESFMTIESHTKERLKLLMDKPHSLTYVGSATANVFGHNLTYPFIRTLCLVKLEKPEKIAKLLDVLEEGETFSMAFIPGEETGIGEYVDQLGKTIDNPVTIPNH